VQSANHDEKEGRKWKWMERREKRVERKSKGRKTYVTNTKKTGRNSSCCVSSS
jgi:hypothetical protein